MRPRAPNITRGIKVPSLSRTKKWKFVPAVKPGEEVEAGDIIGTVQETIVVEHRIMVPFGVSGVVESIEDGEFTVDEPICKVKMADGSVRELTMMQKWPVRRGRPYKEKSWFQKCL